MKIDEIINRTEHSDKNKPSSFFQITLAGLICAFLLRPLAVGLMRTFDGTLTDRGCEMTEVEEPTKVTLPIEVDLDTLPIKQIIESGREFEKDEDKFWEKQREFWNNQRNE